MPCIFWSRWNHHSLHNWLELVTALQKHFITDFLMFYIRIRLKHPPAILTVQPVIGNKFWTWSFIFYYFNHRHPLLKFALKVNFTFQIYSYHLSIVHFEFNRLPSQIARFYYFFGFLLIFLFQVIYSFNSEGLRLLLRVS